MSRFLVEKMFDTHEDRKLENFNDFFKFLTIPIKFPGTKAKESPPNLIIFAGTRNDLNQNVQFFMVCTP